VDAAGTSDSEARSAVPGKWAAAVLYLSLTLLLAFPLSVKPGRVLLADGPDIHLFMWTLAWDTHAFLHQPLSIFEANIFFPNHDTLAYSENLIGDAFFAAPILWLTNNPVLALNLVTLLSCVLCGLGAYVLGRRLGLSGSAALLCGVIFAFSPPRFFRISQLHLTSVQWIPFSLASFHAYLDGGQRRDLRLAAGFLSLQALSSGHGAVFLVVATATMLVYRLAMGEPVAWRRRMVDLGLIGVALLAVSVGIFLPYRVAQAEVGLRRGLGNWATVPESFIASPTHVHTALLSLIGKSDMSAPATAYLFPGYVPLLLALAVLIVRKPRTPALNHTWPRSSVWSWIASILSFGALSMATLAGTVFLFGAVRLRLGSTVLLTARSALRPSIVAVALAGLRMLAAARVPLAPAQRMKEWGWAWLLWAAPRRRDPAPIYTALVFFSVSLSLGPPISLWPLLYSLPLFNFIRVPTRFTILGLLGLGVLAGIGFDRLTSRIGLRARHASTAIVGALLVAEFAAFPLPVVPYRLDIPAADRWLAQQQKPFVVVEVPVTTLERNQSNYMLHSMAHWQKTVNGYSGILPSPHDELFGQLRLFPSDESVRRLAQLGVTYVVVHTSWFAPERRPALEEALRAFAPQLKLEYTDPDSRVYSLQRPLATVGMR
jgi:hypothetical protein